jgi:hypothetical protein
MNSTEFNLDNLEAVEPLKVFTDAFNTPKMYRFNNKGLRYYFDDEYQLFASVTSIIDAVHCDKYVTVELVDKYGGKDGYNRFMKERATYGTILHICLERYMMSGQQGERSISTETIQNIINNNVEKANIEAKTCKWWAKDIKQDLGCIVKFLNEYNVRPLAIEYVGKAQIDGYGKYAGAIDLICTLDIKEKGFWGETYKTGADKGQPKETTKVRTVPAIVDFKSGRNGFYYSHALQLAMYRDIVAGFQYEADGEIKTASAEDIKLYNVAPNATGKTYKIKDQTHEISDEEIMATALLFKHKFFNPPTTIEMASEPITDISQTISVDIKDYLKELIVKKNLTRLTA